MDDPGTAKTNILMAENDPGFLLRGKQPRLIDEWQLAPQLWDAARFMVSHEGGHGQLIFTGSAVPPDLSRIAHTGTGRFAWLTMRPMSLWESGDSNGSVSLSDLFTGKVTSAEAADITLQKLGYLLCCGGWPASLELNEKAALKQARNYIDAVCHSDISRVDNISRNPDSAQRLLRSYARYQGGQVPVSTISADISSSGSISDDTVASYISALKKIFVIEDMAAWSPNLQSRTAVRTSDTRYFADPSIASAALGVGPDDFMKDLNTMGLVFETLAVRDLRVYAGSLDGQVYHYRDGNGLECDAVIHLRNGHYGLVEIKLGGETLIEEGAATLKKLAGKIDTERMNPPAFLMVLTGLGKYSYRREDGVAVVPIGCLKD